MNKIIAASIAALVAVSLCSCSSVNSSSSNDGTASVSSDSHKNYELVNFSFSADGSLTDERHYSVNATGKDEQISFEGKYFSSLTAAGKSICHRTPELMIEEDMKMYGAESGISDLRTDTIQAGDLTVYAIHYRCKDEEKDKTAFSSYLCVAEDRLFSLSGFYNASHEKKCIELLDDIARSIKYTSDYRLPDEPWEYSGKYISLSGSADWCADTSDFTSDENVSSAENIELKLQKADDLKKSYSVASVRVTKELEFDTAAEYADQAEEQTSGSSFITILDRSSSEIAGRPAELLSTLTSISDTYLRKDRYWLMANDALYIFNVVWACDENGDDAYGTYAELKEAISRFTIPELSEDELKQLDDDQGTARMEDFNCSGITFTADRSFKESDHTSPLNIGEFYSPPTGIRLYIKASPNPDIDVRAYAEEKSKSPGERLGGTADVKQYSGKYDIWSVKILPEDTDDHCDLYFYTSDNGIFVSFELTCSQSDTDRAEAFMEQMINTLDLSGLSLPE